MNLWDAKTGELKFNLVGKDGSETHAIAFSPDGQLLVSARWFETNGVSDDGDNAPNSVPGGGGKTAMRGVVEFWNPHTGKDVKDISFADLDPCSLAFSPDGSRLAIGLRSVEERLGRRVFSTQRHHPIRELPIYIYLERVDARSAGFLARRPTRRLLPQPPAIPMVECFQRGVGPRHRASRPQ